MNAPAAELARAAELTRLTAERDALAAENARLREAGEQAKAAWRAFCDAPNMQDDNEFDALLKAMADLARSLVEAPR